MKGSKRSGFEHPYLVERKLVRLRGCVVYVPCSKNGFKLWGERAVYVEEVDDPRGLVWFDNHLWIAEKKPMSEDIEEDEDCYYVTEKFQLTNSKHVA